MEKFNQTKYIEKYKKENYKRLVVDFNKVKDKDVLDYLASKDNMNAYIRELIRKDIKRHK